MNPQTETENLKSSAPRVSGRVVTWNPKFNHGFIAHPQDSKRAIYVSYTEVPFRLGHGKTLKPGETVEFLIVPGNKPGRLNAVEISFPDAH